MPRSAKRPVDTRYLRPVASRPPRKSDDVSNSRSTDRHIDAMRLTSLTAGPTMVKSSRSSLPILP